MINYKVRDGLVFLISLTLIYIDIPTKLISPIRPGPFANQLVFYPLCIGLIVTIYWHIRGYLSFSYSNRFLKYVAVFSILGLVTIIWSYFNFPYWDLAIGNHALNSGKLGHILNAIGSVLGILISDQNRLVTLSYMVKGLIEWIIFIFGTSYMIYSWYQNDDNGVQKALSIMAKGLFTGLIIYLLYGILDFIYQVANPHWANELLWHTNYALHAVDGVVDISWNPLWKGQFRSLLTEPSRVGNYSAIIFPILIYAFMNQKIFGLKKYPDNTVVRALLLLLIFLFSFSLFLAQARTATCMLLGMVVLWVLMNIFVYKKRYLKEAFWILGTLILAFAFSLVAINHFVTLNEGAYKGISVVPKTEQDQQIDKDKNSHINNPIKSINDSPGKATNLDKQGNALKDKKVPEKKSTPKGKQNFKIQVNASNYLASTVTSLGNSNARSNTSRYSYIKAFIYAGSIHPILGSGPKLSAVYASKYLKDTHNMDREAVGRLQKQEKEGVLNAPIAAFNEFIQRFAEYGILGLIIFLVPFGYAVYKLLMKLRSSDRMTQDLGGFALLFLVSNFVAMANGAIYTMYGPCLALSIAYLIIDWQERSVK